MCRSLVRTVVELTFALFYLLGITMGNKHNKKRKKRGRKGNVKWSRAMHARRWQAANQEVSSSESESSLSEQNVIARPLLAQNVNMSSSSSEDDMALTQRYDRQIRASEARSRANVIQNDTGSVSSDDVALEPLLHASVAQPEEASPLLSCTDNELPITGGSRASSACSDRESMQSRAARLGELEALANETRADREAASATRHFLQELSPEQRDALMVDNREHPALRLLFRLDGAAKFPINYHEPINNLSAEDIETEHDNAEDNWLVTKEVCNLIMRMEKKCPDCRNEMTAKTYGKGLARRFIVKCKVARCPNNWFTGAMKLGEFSIPNLIAVYLNKLMDTGYQGFQHMCWATHMKPFSEPTWHKHSQFINRVLRDFTQLNMTVVFEDVKRFYERHELGVCKDVLDKNGEIRHDILDVTICMDGVFSHPKESRQCTTFIVCAWTGRPLDVITSEKCFSCPNHPKRDSVCPHGLTHGSPGDLERANALKLFGRSLDLGFRYVDYVGDGDLKIVSALRDFKPYGDGVTLKKTECANHLVKRIVSKVKKWGEGWTMGGFEERDELRRKQQKAREDKISKKQERDRKRVEKAKKREEIDRRKEERARERDRKMEERDRKKEERAKATGKATPGQRVKGVRTRSSQGSDNAVPPSNSESSTPTPQPSSSRKPDFISPPAPPKTRAQKLDEGKVVSVPLMHRSHSSAGVRKSSTSDVDSERLSPAELSQKMQLVSPDSPQQGEKTSDPSFDSAIVNQLTPLSTGIQENNEGGDTTHGSRISSGLSVHVSEDGSAPASSQGDQLDAFTQELDEQPSLSNSQVDDSSIRSLEESDDPSNSQVDEAPSNDLSSRPLEDLLEYPIGHSKPPWETPSWLIETYPSETKPIEHLFSESKVRDIGAKYRLAVYSHYGLANQKKAVRAVLWHELDHMDTTLAQKEHYHRYCDQGVDSGCQFQAHIAQGKSPSEFRKIDTGTFDPNVRESWTHGLYAGMDTLFPEAFGELVCHFESISCYELMSRCSRQRTTNLNESLHQKMALMVHKCKSHGTENIEFGTHHLLMSQNLGYHDSSMVNIFGWMTDDISKDLRKKDQVSVRSAQRKHKLEKGTTTHHRVKKSTGPRRGGRGGGRARGVGGAGVRAGARADDRADDRAGARADDRADDGAGGRTGDRAGGSRAGVGRAGDGGAYESGMGD